MHQGGAADFDLFIDGNVYGYGIACILDHFRQGANTGKEYRCSPTGCLYSAFRASTLLSRSAQPRPNPNPAHHHFKEYHDWLRHSVVVMTSDTAHLQKLP